MSTSFVGLPISAELSNGTLVEGIIHHIDPSSGKLGLAQARLMRFDGSFSEIQPNFILEKDSVKDLMLLSTTRHTTSATPASSHSSHQPSPLPSFASAPSTSLSTPKHLDDQLTNSVATLTLHQQRTSKSTRRRGRDPIEKQHSKVHKSSRNNLSGSTNGPDSGISAHEDTDGLPTPELSPPITTQVQTSSTPNIVRSDFSQDFDFQAGLMAFDKAKLWAEIASTDSTDPNDRLIAHNRRKTNGTNFPQAKSGENYPLKRNLGPMEMVLSLQEQATNGSTVLNSWLQQPPRINYDSCIISSDGYPIYPVTFERLNQALSSASVEYGPSFVQRIENASRSMTSYIIKTLRHLPEGLKSFKNLTISIIVASNGSKGSCAIRTGALLALKGFQVFLVLRISNSKLSKARNDAFEFQLRLFSSTGAVICPDLQGLPSSPTMIIEALSENSITPLDHHKIIDKAFIAYTLQAPTISIDTPSYINYNTGEPLAGAAFIPASKYLVCLGALPTGILACKSRPSEICLIDLTLTPDCWLEVSEDDDSLKNQMASNGHVSVPPATWGDDWYSIVKLNQ